MSTAGRSLPGPRPGVAGAAGRRSRRDWAVDATLFTFAVVFVLVTGLLRRDSLVPEPEWLLDLDQVVGALGCAALWWRRRWPTLLAVALGLASAAFETVAGAGLVALFTVAVHQRPARTAWLFALSLVTGACFVVLRPDPDGAPAGLVLMLGLALQSATVGWGLFVRHRRQLISSLRERADRAGAEAELRVEQAQRRARDEIARELHDVLGHRLSLLSVHAGALEYRPGAPPEDVSRAAAVIRENAHLALQDLREVVGVLRAPAGELPQPTLADMPRLVAESRRAGMAASLTQEVTTSVPEHLGRTVHRTVQEALTNARKHAAGSAVTVRVAGEPGHGLEVEVVDDGPSVPEDRGDSCGQGLLGLTERVALVGGRLTYGPRPGGGWQISVWLPWSA